MHNHSDNSDNFMSLAPNFSCFISCSIDQTKASEPSLYKRFVCTQVRIDVSYKFFNLRHFEWFNDN